MQTTQSISSGGGTREGGGGGGGGGGNISEATAVKGAETCRRRDWRKYLDREASPTPSIRLEVHPSGPLGLKNA